ncbi:hypothetical protein HK100_012587 [Physocladia obscura]|uniref:F-box domain-containing protein n=1 Tax=Physocladia obscura TaxID=109957 RepID=A0AAD5XHI5_9FUNG|nr:hypothetical protein HK100_012587 [Physocladia obscura]
MDTLPEEITADILSRIHPKEIVVLRGISHTIFEITSTVHFARSNLKRFLKPRTSKNERRKIDREFDRLFFKLPPHYQQVYVQTYLIELEGLDWGRRLYYQDTAARRLFRQLDDGPGLIGLWAPIPAAISFLADTLKHLVLSSCDLIGEIPSEITQLMNLCLLDFSKNSLSGHIPEDIGNMRSLKSIDLRNNQLIGSIPISIGELSQLEVLCLSYNNLSGLIPLSMGNLKNLTDLILTSNRISGDIPIEVYQLPNLVELQVKNTDCDEPDMTGVRSVRFVVGS